LVRHIIYKIINNINQKYYIGRHSTDNIDDNYMGSGIGIKNAINKYGIENFSKEVIAEANSSEELWELEKQIVNEQVVKDENSYNMAYGGKHYLYGLKQYDKERFVEHQRKAGLKGGKAALNRKDIKKWHSSGGLKSSTLRSQKYIYRITTAEKEIFVVNGIEFKKLCKEKKWNYNTLHWKKSIGSVIKKGIHKGFLVEQLSLP